MYPIEVVPREVDSEHGAAVLPRLTEGVRQPLYAANLHPQR
jgi:hypothetical protein